MQRLRSLSQTDEVKAAARSTQPITTTDALFATGSHQVAGWPLPAQFESCSVPAQAPQAAPAESNVPPALPVHPLLLNLPQAAPGATGPARRLVVIHADKKRKRKKTARAANAPARHLKPRYRQMIVLTAILIVSGFTLATLVPLSTGQSAFSLFSKLGTLIQSGQSNSEVQAQMTQTASQLPPLNISRSQYVAIAEQDAINVGISPVYFVRQIQVESGFNPNAVSPSGAVGIAQFLPGTAAGLGIDPRNPIQALQGAAKLMANLYHQYGDYAKALAAYNAGSANLNNAIRSCGAGWLSCMPAETQHYVSTIMG